MAAVAKERGTVGISNIAEHTHNTAMFRSPWQNGQRGWVGMQKEIRFDMTAKSRDRPGINGNAVAKGAFCFSCHDGNILLCSVNIAECQTDEFHIFFLNKLDDLFFCIVHKIPAFCINLPHTFVCRDCCCPE